MLNTNTASGTSSSRICPFLTLTLDRLSTGSGSRGRDKDGRETELKKHLLSFVSLGCGCTRERRGDLEPDQDCSLVE
jgi:hypothetical protein